MNTPHTPGPWELCTDESPGETIEIRHKGALIATIHGTNDFPCLPHDDEQEIARIDAEIQANALLILAAPDLLAVVNELVRDAEKAANPTARMFNYEAALAAIAKATEPAGK